MIEASGSPSGWKTAADAVGPRGTIVLKSTYHAGFEFNPSPMVVDEVTVIGSRCGPFRPALSLLERGLVQVHPLIQARYPLSEAIRAFEHAAQHGALKVLVDI